jgi:hypothetical protein
MILVSGVPISWKSKGQATVTLSSTEAEYVAMCDGVREVKFITQVLVLMNIEFKKPINVYVDNIGAIFLTENRNSGEKTKLIDVKYKYIREQINEGLIQVRFEKSQENLADLFTKNLKGEAYKYHANKLLAG